MANEPISLKILHEGDAPWYKDGLRFECTGCGKCCTGSPGYVWITPEEIEKIADHLNLSLSDFSKRYLRVVNGNYALKERIVTYDCVFLDGKQCSIYSLRPKQCKTFPWWVQNLQTPEDWELAAKRCEGINFKSAPVTRCDVIVKQLQDGDGIDEYSGGN